MKLRIILIATLTMVMSASMLMAQGEKMIDVDRYRWDHPQYNIAYVDVEYGLKDKRSYTVETKMGEAICYFRGIRKSKQGSAVIAEDRDGCRLKLDFNSDRSAVTVSIAGGNCMICGEGMDLTGTYQFSERYKRDLPAAPAPSPTTEID